MLYVSERADLLPSFCVTEVGHHKLNDLSMALLMVYKQNCCVVFPGSCSQFTDANGKVEKGGKRSKTCRSLRANLELEGLYPIAIERRAATSTRQAAARSKDP